MLLTPKIILGLLWCTVSVRRAGGRPIEITVEARADGTEEINGNEVTNVYFVGNSYTSYNTLHAMFASVLKDGLGPELSDEVTTKSINPGGKALFQHYDDFVAGGSIANELAPALTAEERVWDYVILQDQSQLPGFSPFNIGADYYLAQDGVVDLDIAIQEAKAQTMFYMTWGRLNGDSRNLGVYPDFETMQSLLFDGYMRYQDLTTSSERATFIAPVGLVFDNIFNDLLEDGIVPTDAGTLFYNLYNSDGSHPSVSGSYVAALTIYSSITGNDPNKINFLPSGLDESTARTLQEAVGRTVLETFEAEIFPYPWSRSWTGSSVGGTSSPSPTTRRPTTQAPSLMPPSAQPSPQPTTGPSASPTNSPTTKSPTSTPTPSPTTLIPTEGPTLAPTIVSAPTEGPTSTDGVAQEPQPPGATTVTPSNLPTAAPSITPTVGSPTETLTPTLAPTNPSTSVDSNSTTTDNGNQDNSTLVPSTSPTIENPTNSPTMPPTKATQSSLPTFVPTTGPTGSNISTDQDQTSTKSPSIAPTVATFSDSPSTTVSPTSRTPTTGPSTAPTGPSSPGNATNDDQQGANTTTLSPSSAPTPEGNPTMVPTAATPVGDNTSAVVTSPPTIADTNVSTNPTLNPTISGTAGNVTASPTSNGILNEVEDPSPPPSSRPTTRASSVIPTLQPTERTSESQLSPAPTGTPVDSSSLSTSSPSFAIDEVSLTPSLLDIIEPALEESLSTTAATSPDETSEASMRYWYSPFPIFGIALAAGTAVLPML